MSRFREKVRFWLQSYAKALVFSFVWLYRMGPKSRIVVYTAIFGDSDQLHLPLRPYRRIPFVDYVCFTDESDYAGVPVWKVKVIKRPDSVSPRFFAKQYKILPHNYFKKYKYSIWVDGSRHIANDPRQMILKHLKVNDISMFSHHATDCCYEEGERCIAQAKDYPERIRAQLKRYEEESMPRHRGLFCGGVILRRHGSEEIINLMNDWYEEVRKGSLRDQLSLPYVLWKNQTGITPIEYDGKFLTWFRARWHTLERLHRPAASEENFEEHDSSAADVMFIGDWNYNSCRWVGKDIACRLASGMSVDLGSKYHRKNPARCNVFVKFLPEREEVEHAKANGAKVIYIPVDYFGSESEIKKSAPILKACDTVLLHSKSLLPYFSGLTSAVPVEHYSKYVIKEEPVYKKDGFILWIGQFDHIGHVLRYLKGHRLPYPVKFLSNPRRNYQSYKYGMKICRQLGVVSMLDKIDLVEWNEVNQYRYMAEAKAAIDIKGSDFRQRHKPPTKVHQYLLSGIPAAVNQGCNSYSYLKSQGLNICSPEETKRWFSEDYWREVQEFRPKLQEETSIHNVTLRYEEVISPSAVCTV